MLADFNMDNNKITNLSTDAAGILSAADIRYVNQAKAETVATLTNSFIKKINEAHISRSTKTKMFSGTSGRRSTSQRAKPTSSLMALKSFCLHLMMSTNKLTALEWGREQNTGIHPVWALTCTNFQKVGRLW